jgi:mRNA interferase MazF
MTPPMTPFEPGDVVLVPFPFTDFSTLKQRPCVVLSSARFNRSRPDVILAAITSRVAGRAADDEYLLTEREQRLAGLPRPSKVKAGKIVTIDQRLVRARLGRLPVSSWRRVRALVHRIV